MKKFVKRHKNPDGPIDDDTITTASNGSKKESFLKRLLSPKKSAAPEESKKEPKEETAALEPVPEPEIAVEPEVPEIKDAVYEDDNAGKNDKCECNACVIS